MQADPALCRVGIREFFCLERRGAIIGDSQCAVPGILNFHCHGPLMRIIRDAVQFVVFVHAVRDLFPDRIDVFTDVFLRIFDWRECRCLTLFYRIACLNDIAGCIKQFESELSVSEIVVCRLLRAQHCTSGRAIVGKYDCLILLGQLAAVGSSGLLLMLNHSSFFIKNIVGDSSGESIPVFICEYFFDFILRSPLKAAEHFLFAVLQFEFHDAVFKLVITIFLVVVRIDSAVFLQDGNPEIVIPFQIRLLFTSDLFFNDQSLKRPVLDLHAVGEVVNKVRVIHQCHVIGQGDQVIEPDLSVIIRSLNFLQMIDFIEVNVDVLAVNDCFAILIGSEEHFAHCIIVVKIQTILRKKPELYTG